jgi:hypothetical protein
MAYSGEKTLPMAGRKTRLTTVPQPGIETLTARTSDYQSVADEQNVVNQGACFIIN